MKQTCVVCKSEADDGSGRERLVVDGFWGAVPLYVIKDHRLRAGHLRVLTAILSCPSPHFPSRQEISTRCGHTPRYCGKMICEMVELGEAPNKEGTFKRV